MYNNIYLVFFILKNIFKSRPYKWTSHPDWGKNLPPGPRRSRPHNKTLLFNIQVDLQIAFLYEALSLWPRPLNIFIRAKDSFANETLRSAVLPHRETGCLPIVLPAWERWDRQGCLALLISGDSKKILFNSGIISLNVSLRRDIR